MGMGTATETNVYLGAMNLKMHMMAGQAMDAIRAASSIPLAVGEQINTGFDRFQSACASQDQWQLLGDLDRMKQARGMVFGRPSPPPSAPQIYNTQTVAPAKSERKTIEDIKAAYLVKALTLNEFPNEESLKVFKIAVVGDKKLKAAVERYLKGEQGEGTKVRGRPIELVDANDPANLHGLQMLYTGPNCDQRKYLDNAARKGILTVDSSPRDSKLRSCMRFVPIRNHVRFELQVDEIRRQGIKVSPRWVKVAHKLHKDPVIRDKDRVFR